MPTPPRPKAFACGFVNDRIQVGRIFRTFHFIDEFTTRARVILVKRALNSTDVVDARTCHFMPHAGRPDA